MKFKSDIETLLESLSANGIDRSQIEKDLGYSNNYIDQTLSRGGNKKFLNALQRYALQKATLGNKANGGQKHTDSLTGAHVTLQDYIDLLKKTGEKAEANNDKLLSALEKVAEMYSTLNQVKANSDGTKEQLDAIVDEVRSEHAVIMDSLDRIERNPVGTNATVAGNLEIDRKRKRKGRHVGAGK